MFEPIGRAKINTVDLSGKIAAFLTANNDRPDPKYGNSVWKRIYTSFKNQRSPEFELLNKLYTHWAQYGRSYEQTNSIQEKADALAEECRKLLRHAEENEIPLKCLYMCEEFTVVSLGSDKSSMMLPPDVVTIVPYTDYSALSASERKALLSGASVETSNDQQMSVFGCSLNDAKTDRDAAAGRVADLKQQMEDIKEAKTGELAKLQAEIDRQIAELTAKKEAMMAVLNEQMAAMKAEMEKMEFRVHVLDSEIYAIRCYTGEIVEFHCVKKGAFSPADTPIVFYQKMRYMDEELGKLASLRHVDFSDADTLDALLKYSPAALDTFCPSLRSIMLVRVSRSCQHFYCDETYRNLLDNYEVFHGKKICVILRDGENVWTAWTDDERVMFDDDAFLRPHEARPMTPGEEAKYEQDEYESDEAYEKRMKVLKRKSLDEGFSRMFVYSVLQGVLDRGMIQFPEPVNVMKPSPFIVLSYADGWLTDERYGTLSEMIERCNSELATGDVLMTVQHLAPGGDCFGRGRYDKWANDRGRGEKNRVHDVDASDRTLYPLNFIEHNVKYEIVTKDLYDGTEGEPFERWLEDAKLRDHLKNGWGHYTIKSYKNLGHEEYRYYISLEKGANWETGIAARANFEVDPSEFWNLTYMNSCWLEYIYNTKKTGGVEVGRKKVDYAHLIPYLKTALEHVRSREETFSGWLKKCAPEILNDSEWPAQLSEWMLEKKYHNFSEFRAKQFAKWYAEKNKAGA